MSADLVAFLKARLDEDVEQAMWTGNALITQGAPALDLSVEVAERRARLLVQAAEAQQQLFEETVRPYLGTAGPGGRNAERQLRLLALPYSDHPEFREEWRP